MNYADALLRAFELWGEGAVVWRSYDGLHVVGRKHGDVAIEALGEGETWEAAFAAVALLPVPVSDARGDLPGAP